MKFVRAEEPIKAKSAWCSNEEMEKPQCLTEPLLLLKL